MYTASHFASIHLYSVMYRTYTVEPFFIPSYTFHKTYPCLAILSIHECVSRSNTHTRIYGWYGKTRHYELLRNRSILLIWNLEANILLFYNYASIYQNIFQQLFLGEEGNMITISKFGLHYALLLKYIIFTDRNKCHLYY